MNIGNLAFTSTNFHLRLKIKVTMKIYAEDYWKEKWEGKEKTSHQKIHEMSLHFYLETKCSMSFAMCVQKDKLSPFVNGFIKNWVEGYPSFVFFY